MQFLFLNSTSVVSTVRSSLSTVATCFEGVAAPFLCERARERERERVKDEEVVLDLLVALDVRGGGALENKIAKIMSCYICHPSLRQSLR